MTNATPEHTTGNIDSSRTEADAGSELRTELIEQKGGARAVPSARPSHRISFSITAAAVVLLIAAAIWHSQPRIPTVINAVRITNDGKAKSPLNSPVTDGARLYFVEGWTWTTGSRIAQLSSAGGETTWISTTLPEVRVVQDISPNRSELLVTNGGIGPFLSQLWLQPLPAGTPRRIGNLLVAAACWTPDGTHIVYADGNAIAIANRDGGEPRELAEVAGHVVSIRFSPDGRRLRFDVLHQEMDSSSIWEMDANGKNLRPLLPNWQRPPYQCCGNWSPDGEYYYFRAGRGVDQTIWVMPEHRSIFRSADPAPGLLASGPLRFSAPLPSPDGKRLFVLGEEPRVELFRYDSELDDSIRISRASPPAPWISRPMESGLPTLRIRTGLSGAARWTEARRRNSHFRRCEPMDRAGLLTVPGSPLWMFSFTVRGRLLWFHRQAEAHSYSSNRIQTISKQTRRGLPMAGSSSLQNQTAWTEPGALFTGSI
jgi:hypothetical protein